MLQHASMSHAFQSATTDGRTYQLSKLPELDYAINITVFGDILELDEDEEYFSRSLVCDYFTLAQRTFAETDACLETQDIERLWSKALFLKGPSATLGIYKVESICARIEQITAVANTFQADADSKTTLCNSARTLLDQAKQDFIEAKSALRKFYGMD